MLKMLNPIKLRPSTGKKLVVKTFPGATTADMNYYVKPTLARNPQLVILHVGTNDIQHGKEPEEIAKEVEALSKCVMVDGLTKVAIYEIIHRDDDKLNGRIEKVEFTLG